MSQMFFSVNMVGKDKGRLYLYEQGSLDASDYRTPMDGWKHLQTD